MYAAKFHIFEQFKYKLYFSTKRLLKTQLVLFNNKIIFEQVFSVFYYIDIFQIYSTMYSINISKEFVIFRKFRPANLYHIVYFRGATLCSLYGHLLKIFFPHEIKIDSS